MVRQSHQCGGSSGGAAFILDSVEEELTRRWNLKIGPSREMLSPRGLTASGSWSRKYRPVKRMKLLGRNFHQNGGIVDDFRECKSVAWSCYLRNLRRCNKALSVKEMAKVLNRAVHSFLCRKAIDLPQTQHRENELDRAQRSILRRAKPVRRLSTETYKQFWTRSSKRVAQVLSESSMRWSTTWTNQQSKWNAHMRRHKHDLPFFTF